MSAMLRRKRYDRKSQLKNGWTELWIVVKNRNVKNSFFEFLKMIDGQS